MPLFGQLHNGTPKPKMAKRASAASRCRSQHARRISTQKHNEISHLIYVEWFSFLFIYYFGAIYKDVDCKLSSRYIYIYICIYLYKYI